MGTFKYGWLEQMRFARERDRQVKSGKVPYVESWSKEATTYWNETGSVPPPHVDQKEILTEFARSLVAKKPGLPVRDPNKRAPEDIYPVF